MDQSSEGSIHLEARTIPLPRSLSPEAKQFLGSVPSSPPRAYPAIDDKDGWRRHVEEFDNAYIPLLEPGSLKVDAEVQHYEIGNVKVVSATPRVMPGDYTNRVLLYAHGGALIYLGGAAVELWARIESGRAGCKVVAVDYRMPPDHPFPAGLEDMLTVYRALLQDHGNKSIAIVGLSSGSNTAAATALRIRDEGLPEPGAVVLFTPELDLTESGDSFQTAETLDVILPRGLLEVNKLYAAGQDLANPYLSPIFADFAKGFPPTFIQSGTRDLFLSNAVLMHRALSRHDLETELHIWDAMPHGGFGGATPEDAEMVRLYRRFLDRHLA